MVPDPGDRFRGTVEADDRAFGLDHRVHSISVEASERLVAFFGGFDVPLGQELTPDQWIETARGVDRVDVVGVLGVAGGVDLLQCPLHRSQADSSTSEQGSIDVEEDQHG